jgi:hypothetical protein
MKLEFGRFDRRTLIPLVLAVVIFGGLKFVVFPIHDRLVVAGDAAAEKQDELRRYRRAQLRKGQYAQLTDLANKKAKEAESGLVTGANASLVSAELQSLAETTAGKVGVTLGQRSVGTPKRLNGFYSEFPITLGFEATPGQLVSFLAELRAAPKLITVRSLQVSPIQPVQEAPKGADVSKNVRINMTLAVLSTAEMVTK